MSVEKFSAIFDGLQQAYGTFKIEKQTQSGKNAGKAAVIREPRTTALWEGHLSGEGKGIGIIPINEDNNVKWGCIDIDQYPLDHTDLVTRILAGSDTVGCLSFKIWWRSLFSVCHRMDYS